MQQISQDPSFGQIQNQPGTDNSAEKPSSGSRFRNFFKSGKNIMAVGVGVFGLIGLVTYLFFGANISTFLGGVSDAPTSPLEDRGESLQTAVLMQDVEYNSEGDGSIQLVSDKLTGSYVSDALDAGRPVDWKDLWFGIGRTDCDGHLESNSADPLCILDQDQTLHLNLLGHTGGAFVDSSPLENHAHCDHLRSGCPISEHNPHTNGLGQKFNGQNQYLGVNAPLGRAFTVCTWVKLDDPEKTQPTYIMQADSQGAFGYLAYINYRSQKKFFFVSKFRESGKKTMTHCASEGSLDNVTEWNHVCVTSSGVEGAGSRRVYINGVDKTAPSTGLCKQIAQDLSETDRSKIKTIAKAGTDKFFKGSLDEIMVYNRELSGEEIKYYADHQPTSVTRYYRTCEQRGDCEQVGGDWTLCEGDPCNLTDLPDSQYLQYKVDFTSPFPGLSKKFVAASAEFAHDCLGEDNDGDGVTDCDDCDDNNPYKSPNIDNDGDGYNSCVDCHDEVAEVYPGVDVDQDGSACEFDCEDLDPEVYPGSDTDGDGYFGCTTDPDDHDSLIFPGSDADGDGYKAAETDCDDGDGDIHPGAKELCGDHKDNDCSGTEVIQCVEACENAFLECFNNQPHRCEIENGVASYQPIADTCPVADTCYSVLIPGGEGSKGVVNGYTNYAGCNEPPTTTTNRVENQYGFIEFAQLSKKPLRPECFFLGENLVFIEQDECRGDIENLLPVTIGMKLGANSHYGLVSVGAGNGSDRCVDDPYCQNGGIQNINNVDYQILTYTALPPAGRTIGGSNSTEGSMGLVECFMKGEDGALYAALKLLSGIAPGNKMIKIPCIVEKAIEPFIPKDCLNWNAKAGYLDCVEADNGGKPPPNPVCTASGTQTCTQTGSCKCPVLECKDEACGEDCSPGTCSAVDGKAACDKCSWPETAWVTGDSCVCLNGCQPPQNLCGDSCCGGDDEEDCPEDMHVCDEYALCCDNGKACCGGTCCDEGQTCNEGVCGEPGVCDNYGCMGENGPECLSFDHTSGTCARGSYEPGCVCCECNNRRCGTCNPEDGAACPPCR